MGAVLTALAVKKKVDYVFRVGVVHYPAAIEHLELSLVEVVEERRGLGLGDRNIDAQVLLPHLDDRFRDRPRGSAGTDLR